ncbi:hypothetical protein JAAARDRAFT_165024 [Jaapia argillacea MUCL 33604]|uniref:non-specific serine/threonine protein kinase n=1 Tax=Jaapia argillacea MUCL 33604 TaxID=933084 RepID=A0A067P5L7_9AGAM|nr:hypothetical protein JAAARDRAFT_165024 [Jaapia argillacea MUCL 33604]
MGNTHSGSTLTRTGGALDSFVAELGSDIVYEKSLGSARFLKTVKCRHRNGYLVVKIFIKPDPGFSLRTYHRRLKVEREALQDLPNVYGYQAFVETDRAGYVIRQWVASNLYDRISTRPFLTPIEKLYISYQLLSALHQTRTLSKISHGDIKSENVLVTSSNTIYLSDFSTSYKPTYLPLDDPSDFSFYFDTSGRRTCYLAPERFYTASENPEVAARKQYGEGGEGEEVVVGGKRDGRVSEAMDVFSVGCVLAELWMEGTPLFTLSQLFKYREGELSVDGALGGVEDEGVRGLIKQMISLDPLTRPSFDTLLQTSRGTVFPECFYSFLHNYVSTLNEPVHSPSTAGTHTAPTPTHPHLGHPHSGIAPSLPHVTLTPSPSTLSSAPSTAAGKFSTNPGVELGAGGAGSGALPNDSDRKIERIWEDYEGVIEMLVSPPHEGTLEENAGTVRVDEGYVGVGLGSYKAFQDVLPVELHIPNRESKLLTGVGQRRAASEDGPALILLSLVCANIRNCLLPSSKLRALDVFLALSTHLTDEAKLDRLVPYVVDLLHDEAAVVRGAALRTLVQVTMLVTVITPSNAAIFPEYIFQHISPLVQDQEVSVRSLYAQCLAPLADTAVRYLEMGQALKAHGTLKISADRMEYDEAHFEVSYDASMQELQNVITDHLSTLLVDSSSVVKRAVLHNISSLCIFLGRQKTNDVLLSHMITYLNDREWLLRYAFFESIVDVAACAGVKSLEEYILPLMIQALSDVEETVVAKVLASLTSLCELGLFARMRIWELMSATLGFLYHPNIWIRQGAAAFIASAAKHLLPSDVWCILYPSLKHFLRADVRSIDEQSLLLSLKPPLSRQIFDASVAWAMKAEKTQFWRNHRSRTMSKVESPKESMVALRKAGPQTRGKSEEDEINLAKLRQIGMTSTEEAKLLAMRDYIVKLADAISSFSSRLRFEAEAESLKTTGDIELQKLGVVPQTVFLRTRPPEAIPRASRRSTFESARILGPNSPRLSRAPSEVGSGMVPFEDLRRRLATINGSASSLAVGTPNRDHRNSLPPVSDTTLHPTSDLPPTLDRPGSPAESITSTTNTSAFRAVNRWHVGGAEKAAPAVGSSRANATGLLETASRMQSEGSPERSGRSSPVSVAGTIRGQLRQRAPPVVPISSYDGQEPGITNMLEQLYLDNNRDLEQDFGPKVHEGPVRRRNAVRHSFSPRDGSTRRVESLLIHHFQSHSDCVTGLAVSPDHAFFVSSSDDKTVKVWDTARLERNVTSKPRHTYAQHHARVKCVCTLEAVHCFASAADDGSLHVVRVPISQSGALPKYNKLQVIREHRVEHPGEYITCMTHYNTDTSSNLIYGTTHSTLCILDLRTMRILQCMNNPRHFGPITCLCLDRKRAWVVVATSTGVLSLWDLRFGILLKSWRAGGSSSAKPVRIHQCVVHPSKGKGRWVMAVIESCRPAGENVTAVLIEVWDIEHGVLVEAYATRTITNPTQSIDDPVDTVGTEPEKTHAAAISALVRSRQANGVSGDRYNRRSRNSSQSNQFKETLITGPSPDIRTIVVGVDFGGFSTIRRGEPMGVTLEGDMRRPSGSRGFMLSGSEDRKIRLWDLGGVERTTVLSGLEPEADKPTYGVIKSATGSTSMLVETWIDSPNSSSLSNRPPQRMSLINHSQQTLLKAHQDTVTALACIDSPFRGGMVSGDRCGVIKVWRVDGMD